MSVTRKEANTISLQYITVTWLRCILRLICEPQIDNFIRRDDTFLLGFLLASAAYRVYALIY